jgi:hypothetical protein
MAKMEKRGRKETCGVGREKFLKNCGAQKDTETIGSVILSWQLLSLPHIYPHIAL